MQNLQTILSILIPLFLGFFIVVPKPYLRWIDAFIGYLVYAILWLIGVGLAQTENWLPHHDSSLYALMLLVFAVGMFSPLLMALFI